MFKRIINKLIYFLLILLGSLTSSLNPRTRMLLGIVLGRIFMLIFFPRIKVAKTNLRNAFPDKEKNWINRTSIQSFDNLGIVMLEILAMRNFSRNELLRLVKFKHFEIFQKLNDKGRGVVIMSGHYGNWEIMALAGGVFLNVPITIVVEQQTNSYINNEMLSVRTKFGNKTVGRYSAARGLVNALSNSECVAFLADQSASPDKDIFVDFFGMPAATYEAPAALALRFNVPIMFCITLRQSDGTYVVELSEIDHSDLKYDKNGIAELTKRHVQFLEDKIRERPGDWSWMHKRWKHKPKVIENE